MLKEDLVDKLYELKKQIEKRENVFKKYRELLLKKVESEKVSEDSSIVGDIATATIVKKIDLKYDVQALEKKFDKAIQSQIISKKYTVIDFNKFKEVMKKYKVPPKEIQKLFNVEKTAINKNINNLFVSGEITKEQIKDCYEINIVRALYLKPNEQSDSKE